MNTARRFHEVYEDLAPSFGYNTRKASAVEWDLVPENNRQLMQATCAVVETEIRADERLRIADEMAEFARELHAAGRPSAAAMVKDMWQRVVRRLDR